MSAVSGMHSSKPDPVPPEYDGLKHLLPESFTPEPSMRYTLRGKDGQDVPIPLIIWGAWSWGDTSTFHWSDDELPALRKAWQECLDRGMTFVDTAQVYGSGKSEEILGDLINNHSGSVPRSKIIVQTKWLPNVTDGATNVIHPVDAPVKQLRKTLERMHLDYIDCYLVHGHVHVSSITQVAKGLAKCVEEGLTRTVGVANYSVDDMLKMREALAELGVPLATNQCEYSILRRMPEMEGMLETCKQHGIVFQSYSSVAQGRLTGKYTRDHPPPKEYRFSAYDMEHVEPVLQVQRQLAQKYNVSVAAVALNWNILKGAVPVVGMRKESQAVENMQALGWRLTREEVAELDKLGFQGKKTKLWQQG
ncbi:putative oxidoreductase [Cladophialophora carrionii]|uniref:Putative oxidoreductase n=1 Tax=Cladophialophora carrionii TaxID=86049 RepID=A0A1C1CTF9_9EURO|nr:putative oxidoreductase [Cladophialophora carrionii]